MTKKRTMHQKFNSFVFKYRILKDLMTVEQRSSLLYELFEDFVYPCVLRWAFNSGYCENGKRCSFTEDDKTSLLSISFLEFEKVIDTYDGNTPHYQSWFYTRLLGPIKMYFLENKYGMTQHEYNTGNKIAKAIRYYESYNVTPSVELISRKTQLSWTVVERYMPIAEILMDREQERNTPLYDIPEDQLVSRFSPDEMCIQKDECIRFMTMVKGALKPEEFRLLQDVFTKAKKGKKDKETRLLLEDILTKLRSNDGILKFGAEYGYKLPAKYDCRLSKRKTQDRTISTHASHAGCDGLKAL